MGKRGIILLLGLCLFGCGYNRFDDYTPAEIMPLPEKTTDIASLRLLYAGSRIDVTDDLVVVGRVTTSDRAGNFFRTFMIEDATGALEIRAGLYDMHRIYPVGTRVAVKLRGMSLGFDQSVLQAGARPLPSSYYSTEYLGNRAIVDRYVVRGGVGEPPVPAVTTIAALNEGMCGRLVRIEGLRLAGATPGAGDPGDIPVTWAIPSPGKGIAPSYGYRKFKDPKGDSLLVVSSGYAAFAAATIPSGGHTITGILSHGTVSGTYGRNVYMLRIRDLDDVTGL